MTVPLKNGEHVQGTLSKAAELREDEAGWLGQRRAAWEKRAGGGECSWRARGSVCPELVCSISALLVGVESTQPRQMRTCGHGAGWCGVGWVCVPELCLFAVTLLDFPVRGVLALSCSAVA